MTYRDETEALRAKVSALEEEVEELRGQLAGGAAPPAPQPTGLAPLAPSEASSISEIVAARERAELMAQGRARAIQDRKRARRAARLARRPMRVSARRQGQAVHMVIERELLRDKLLAQLPWGFGFAFINPGVFIVVPAVLALATWLPAGWAVLLGIVGWAAVLTGLNVLWALVMRPRYVLDVTAEGDFVLHGGSPRSPKLIGRRGKLVVQADEPDPASLGAVQLRDEHSRVDIDKLTAADLELLRGSVDCR